MGSPRSGNPSISPYIKSVHFTVALMGFCCARNPSYDYDLEPLALVARGPGFEQRELAGEGVVGEAEWRLEEAAEMAQRAGFAAAPIPLYFDGFGISFRLPPSM